MLSTSTTFPRNLGELKLHIPYSPTGYDPYHKLDAKPCHAFIHFHHSHPGHSHNRNMEHVFPTPSNPSYIYFISSPPPSGRAPWTSIGREPRTDQRPVQSRCSISCMVHLQAACPAVAISSTHRRALSGPSDVGAAHTPTRPSTAAVDFGRCHRGGPAVVVVSCE